MAASRRSWADTLLRGAGVHHVSPTVATSVLFPTAGTQRKMPLSCTLLAWVACCDPPQASGRGLLFHESGWGPRLVCESELGSSTLPCLEPCSAPVHTQRTPRVLCGPCTRSPLPMSPLPGGPLLRGVPVAHSLACFRAWLPHSHRHKLLCPWDAVASVAFSTSPSP